MILLCCKFEVYGVFYKSNYVFHASTILVNEATTIKSCTIHESVVLIIQADQLTGVHAQNNFHGHISQ